MMNHDFNELLKLAKSGNETALGKLLFRKYDNLVRTVERKFLPGLALPFDAEDIVQQALTEASQKIGEVESDTEEGFTVWLHSIANSRFLDGVRAHKTQKRGGGLLKREADWVVGNDDSIVRTFDRLADSSSTPSKIISLDEKIIALQQQLALLPEHYREAIILKDIQELSRAEAARRMNKTEDEFRGILLRARTQLKNLLGDASQYITNR